MGQSWESRFALNMKEFQGYPIGQLFKYMKDPDIISLAGGLPAPEIFQTAEMCDISQRLLASEAKAVMQYSGISGEASLKEAVAEYLAEDGIKVSQEEVLITSSGQQGLDLTGRLFLNPDDIVILDRPTFAGAIVAFRMQKPLFAGADLMADGSNLEAMADIIEAYARIHQKPKFIYVVPDFQNPTGISFSLEKRRGLVELGRRYEIPIVEDSPYRTLYYGAEPLPTLYSLDQELGGGNVIGLYTFSKLFCPGMRVGFNIGPAEVIAKMTCIKEGSTLNTPRYNQEICTAFLKEMGWQEHLGRCREHYREKLEIFLAALEKHFPPELGVSWTKPQGGLFCWLTLPEEIDATELFFDAIKYKVAFVPGDSFYGSNPQTNHMRLNFSYPSREQLEEAIKRLADCVRNHLT